MEASLLTLMSLSALLPPVTNAVDYPQSTCISSTSLPIPHYVAMVTRTPPSKQVKEEYHLHDGEGYIDIPHGFGFCFRVTVRHLLITDRLSYGLYNDTIKQILNGSKIIIGDMIQSVLVYANYTRTYYISSEPLPFAFELDVQRLYDTLWSVFPSHTLFQDAVAQNINLLLDGLETERVTIFSFAETEEGIELVHGLKRKLRTGTTNRIVREISIRSELKYLWSHRKKEEESEEKYNSLIHRTWATIRNQLIHEDLIVLHMDSSDINDSITTDGIHEFKQFALETIFSRGADLERENLRWMIYDMKFSFELMNLETLKNTSVLYSKVYLPWINMYWKGDDHVIECGEFGKGVRSRGLVSIKGFLELVFLNLTGLQAIERRRADYYISLDETITHANVSSPTWDIMHYPINVIIKFYIVKPVDHWSLFPETNCGAVRSIYSTKQVIERYQSDHRIDKHVLRVSRSKNYRLLGVPVQRNRDPVALVIPVMPFTLKKGDRSYEGIAMDIFHEILRELVGEGIFLNFEYEERKVSGIRDRETGKWGGIFGELQSEETDAVIGIGMMTVTAERKMDFEYTLPFGSAYVTHISERQPYDNWFQFLMPFDWKVWISVTGVIVFSGILFHILHQWNPFDDDLDNNMPFSDSIWHAYLLVTQAGAPFGQRTLPCRIYSVFLWFFALLIMGSYTGNLASFLAEKTYHTPSPLARLIASKSNFTVIGNGSVYQKLLMQKSTAHIARQIKEKNDFVQTYQEGIDKVKNENYVMFGLSDPLLYMESTDNECSLSVEKMATGNRFSEEIAFPMKKTWKYAQQFKNALETIRERGEIQRIYHKWRQFGACKLGFSTEHMKLDWVTSSGTWIVLSIAVVLSFMSVGIKLLHVRLRDKGDDNDGPNNGNQHANEDTGVDNEEEMMGNISRRSTINYGVPQANFSSPFRETNPATNYDIVFVEAPTNYNTNTLSVVNGGSNFVDHSMGSFNNLALTSNVHSEADFVGRITTFV